MKNILVAAVAAAVVVTGIGGSAVAQESIKLAVIAGHPPLTLGVSRIRDLFIPEVDRQLAAAGKYKIDWTQAYGGTVAKPPAVFEAIESGIGDIGYVPALFEGDKLPLEQITYVTPFGTADIGKLNGVMGKLREKIPEMNKAYVKHKQVWLAGIGVDDYHFVSKFPIRTSDDLNGKKIGTAGLAANWLKNTGAVSVAAGLPDYYNAMQTGVYEGIITFESAVNPYKFQEVAPYVTKVSFGAMSASVLTINKSRWDRLPAPVRKAITDAAAKYETDVAAAYQVAGEKSLEAAAAAGAKIEPFPEAERQRLASKLPNLAKAWAEDLDKRGFPGRKALDAYMALSREAGIRHARQWDKE